MSNNTLGELMYGNKAVATQPHVPDKVKSTDTEWIGEDMTQYESMKGCAKRSKIVTFEPKPNTCYNIKDISNAFEGSDLENIGTEEHPVFFPGVLYGHAAFKDSFLTTFPLREGYGGAFPALWDACQMFDNTCLDKDTIKAICEALPDYGVLRVDPVTGVAEGSVGYATHNIGFAHVTGVIDLMKSETSGSGTVLWTWNEEGKALRKMVAEKGWTMTITPEDDYSREGTVCSTEPETVKPRYVRGNVIFIDNIDEANPADKENTRKEYERYVKHEQKRLKSTKNLKKFTPEELAQLPEAETIPFIISCLRADGTVYNYYDEHPEARPSSAE